MNDYRFDIGDTVTVRGDRGKVVGREHVHRDNRRGRQGNRYIVKVPQPSGFALVQLAHETELQAADNSNPARFAS